jgi:hypothetical protein
MAGSVSAVARATILIILIALSFGVIISEVVKAEGQYAYVRGVGRGEPYDTLTGVYLPYYVKVAFTAYGPIPPGPTPEYPYGQPVPWTGEFRVRVYNKTSDTLIYSKTLPINYCFEINLTIPRARFIMDVATHYPYGDLDAYPKDIAFRINDAPWVSTYTTWYSFVIVSGTSTIKIRSP